MSELATGPAAGTQIDANSSAVSTNWWRIGDAIVLALYSSVVLWTVGYHEKWADEAQAWLLARDLDLKTLWFHELRYEGSPGLWHTILYTAQHVFHMRYDSLGYLGAAFAIAGAAVLIFKAPFPRYIRWPLAFTYVMVYQYAVIARPYTMLPLLCFLAAICFKDVTRPVRMTVVLVLLANTSFHGTALAACFGLLYLAEAIKSWKTLNVALRHRFIICGAAMALTFLFILIILKPTPDIEEFAIKSGLAKLSEAERIQLNKITPTLKVTNIISGAFLDFFLPSVIWIALLAAWFATRRRLLVFLLPVGSMIALYSVIHGAAHHHGTAFVAAITALWIAWPTDSERLALSRPNSLAMHGVLALLVCLCIVNIWDAAVVIKREYLYPYCGAEDAAKYIRAVGADQSPMFGMLFGVVGVQAYFDHNILANVPTSYFHHGLPLTGAVLNIEELERVRPEYVVAYSNDPELMVKTGVPQLTTRGYEVVHFSDGYYLYKRAVFEREVYFIFRRTHSPGEQTPWQSGPDR